MHRYPTLRALASAEESTVLQAWEGLGYYSRARNLRRAALAVTERHGGRLPASVESLLELPGIGPYSAGAIASIAFGLPAPIVDGNVVRVLCRLYGWHGDPAKAPLKERLWSQAERLVPEDAASDFNQAMMELGATVCTPLKPKCASCPLRRLCAARRAGIEERLPETAPRRKTIRVERVALVVERAQRLLLGQAPATAARWANLWQFPNADVSAPRTAEATAQAVLRAMGLTAQGIALPFSVQHAITHHRVTLHVVTCHARGTARPGPFQACEWASTRDLAKYPMPAPHRKIANRLQAGRRRK
jgi:A/G-specific adenine glycosylase